MSQNLIQPSFAAGELAPALWARVDLAKFHVGAKTLRNFFVLPAGGATTRPGTQFVGQANTTGTIRLIPFQFNETQSYILEFGGTYIRIINNGGYILDGSGNVFTLTSPFPGSVLPYLRYVQSGDIMTLTCAGIPTVARRAGGDITANGSVPYQLERIGPNDYNWTLTAISFAPIIQPPTGLVAPSGGSTFIYGYVVTAESDSPAEESVASAIVQPSNGALNQDTGVQNTISWTAAANAVRYRVYKANPLLKSAESAIPAGAMYGYIGTTTGTTFVDTNIAPDFTQGPPQATNPFAATSGYPEGILPGCVSYFQGRSVFAGGKQAPDSIWFSQSGSYWNMDTSYPTQDSDAITISIASRQINSIKHLVSVNALLALTNSGAFKISSGSSSGTLTPATTSALPQAYNGCAEVPPIIINNDILYVQARGSRVRDLSYNFYADVFTGSDLTVMSPHLFFGHQILDWCYAEEPFNLVWAVREDGVLLCLTYLKEQDVSAWTRHDSLGVSGTDRILSVATVSEGTEDAVYLAVQRTIPGVNGGAPVIYVERLHSRNFLTNGTPDATKIWFVDSGLQYSGPPQTTFSGLDHLDGATVQIVADGNVVPPQTVVNGQITLVHPAATVTIGLGYSADLETLNMEPPMGLTLQGKRKSISAVTLRLENSRGLKVGPDVNRLAEIKERRRETYGQPPTLTTGDERVLIPPSWNTGGSLWIRQDQPLPATVLGIIPEVRVGDNG